MAAEPPINLRRLRPGGRKPAPGDLFAMQTADDLYLFGRVIEGPMPRERAPMPGAYVVYVYAYRADRPEPDLPSLGPDNLLIPPVFLNQLGWTKGYFLPVGSAPVQTRDRLRRHCFWDVLRSQHRDETGPVDHREPCGEWGLGNHRTLDDLVSDALGISRAPEA